MAELTCVTINAIFLSDDDGVLINLTVRPSLSKYKNHNYQYYYFD